MDTGQRCRLRACLKTLKRKIHVEPAFDLIANGLASRAIGERMIGLFDGLHHDAALASRKFPDMLNLVELSEPGLASGGLDSRRLEHEDGQARPSNLLPFAEQRDVCIAGRSGAAQKRAYDFGAIV